MIEIKDLLSLGYRRLVEGKNKFAKPFGFSIYIFDLDTNEITQHFRSGSDGTLLCWSTKKCEELIEIIEYECYSRPDINTGWYGEFEFLTKEQQVKNWLGNL